jgi:hypothetical protein
MKITVKEKQVKTIPYDEIKPGQVYEAASKVIALKLNDGKSVLLKNVDEDWFAAAKGYFKDAPAIRILGMIEEVIVG